MKNNKGTYINMAKKLLRVRSLSCNNLHSDLCIMRTQDMFPWWRWRQRRWGVCISLTTIPDHGHGRNAQFSPSVPFWNHYKFLELFFLSFWVAEWVTDNCALLNEKGRKRERIFALDSFLGCLESVSWCFWKDWICNKIEHCDVGMVFHSTLESRCHLETNRQKKNTLFDYPHST